MQLENKISSELDVLKSKIASMEQVSSIYGNVTIYLVKPKW